MFRKTIMGDLDYLSKLYLKKKLGCFCVCKFFLHANKADFLFVYTRLKSQARKHASRAKMYVRTTEMTRLVAIISQFV